MRALDGRFPDFRPSQLFSLLTNLLGSFQDAPPGVDVRHSQESHEPRRSRPRAEVLAGLRSEHALLSRGVTRLSFQKISGVKVQSWLVWAKCELDRQDTRR